jgi:hypothetical protein
MVDAGALVVFVVIGVLTHDASFGAFVRDLACVLGGWFAVALAVRLYSRGGWWRVVVTWFAGISLGVLVRAAVVGHWPGAFYVVALVFTGLFVGAARLFARRRVRA